LFRVSLHLKEWPVLILLVRFALNNAISPISGYAPITLFTGRLLGSPLNSIWSPSTNSVLTVLFRKNNSMRTFLLFNNLFKICIVKFPLFGKGARSSKQTSYLIFSSFTVGDFVLYSVPFKPNQKLEMVWRGPARIVNCLNDFVFEVEDLITHRKPSFMLNVCVSTVINL
jgi:hypothetical protein